MTRDIFKKRLAASAILCALVGGVEAALLRAMPAPGEQAQTARRGDANQSILRVAAAIPDGGGFCSLDDSGVAYDITFNGQPLLRKSKTGAFYCCGFTFAVAMQVARERGHLEQRQLSEIKHFQREWYGNTSKSEDKQLILAMQTLGIGREIQPLQAKPGDFVVFSRDNKTGHSAVFLSWVYDHDALVGFRYRSSQPATSGVADRTEYFTSSGTLEGRVMPRYFYVGRMN